MRLGITPICQNCGLEENRMFKGKDRKGGRRRTIPPHDIDLYQPDPGKLRSSMFNHLRRYAGKALTFWNHNDQYTYTLKTNCSFEELERAARWIMQGDYWSDWKAYPGFYEGWSE